MGSNTIGAVSDPRLSFRRKEKILLRDCVFCATLGGFNSHPAESKKGEREMIKDRVTIRIVLSDGFVIRINGEIANKEEFERHLGGINEPVDQLVFYNQEYKGCEEYLPEG